MFTGIIEATGKVARLARGSGEATRLTVKTPLAQKLRLGDSVAVNGVCLTAVELGNDWFAADLLEETLQRTTLQHFTAGRLVNLELPTPAGAPLGGHVVQGHVDGTGRVQSLELEQGAVATWRLAIEVPRELMRHVAEKGSIAVDGVSLTVAAVGEESVEIAIIPHTYDVTNVRTLRAGDAVNLETDPLAKYAESLRRSASALTLESLIARGY